MPPLTFTGDAPCSTLYPLRDCPHVWTGWTVVRVFLNGMLVERVCGLCGGAEVERRCREAM